MFLTESGDLSGLQTYDVQKFGPAYLFAIPGTKLEVEVRFYQLSYLAKTGYFPRIDSDEVYNLAFQVNGVTTQAAKTNLKLYLSILKTVMECAVDFINKTKPAVITVTGNGKDDVDEYNVGSSIKDKLYRQIVAKNLHRLPGYAIVDKPMLDYTSLCIYKKEIPAENVVSDEPVEKVEDVLAEAYNAILFEENQIKEILQSVKIQ